MRINYDAIAQENIQKYGTAINEYGPVLLADLYSDRTHFIYELLQNAEDAQATSVEFRLFSDRLEFEHNGRPFDEADIRGICGLVAGTKKADLTQIGKFGIGFKSVYAHTCSPYIHSGNDHFGIEHYVHPYPIQPLDIPSGNTLFIFPFNHSKKTPQESYVEIAERLTSLGMRTILFLRNISDVFYTIEDGKTGKYLKVVWIDSEEESIRHVKLISEQEPNSDEEAWLVFEQTVTEGIETESLGQTALRVEIAFLCKEIDSLNGPMIKALYRSNLAAFFSTEKETHLGFLVQGPYRTTPARDNVPESDQFNRSLARQTANLVVRALRLMRDRDWLNVSILEAMPIQDEGKFRGTLFEPIYTRVLDAIKEDNLLPAYDRDYVSGKNARLAGSASLRELLSEKQLQCLYESTDHLRWLSAQITNDRTPALARYLTRQIGVQELDAAGFVRRLTADFLKTQSDEWIARFYEFGTTQPSLRSLIMAFRIIRLETGQHVIPFDAFQKPQAYLPTERETRFPTVKRSVCTDLALEFLKAIGLKVPDLADDILQAILPKYPPAHSDDIDQDEHQHDIELIASALHTLPRAKRAKLAAVLVSKSFLLAFNCRTGEYSFKKPGEAYFDNEDLATYFRDNPYAWILANTPVYEKYKSELGELGVSDKPRVSQVVLPKYSFAHNGNVGEEEHCRDIELIFEALRTLFHEKQNELKGTLQSTTFLLAYNCGTGEYAFKKPGDVYFETAELITFFQDNSNAWFLANLPVYEQFVSELSSLGVSDKPRTKQRMPHRDGHVYIPILPRAREHTRGINGFDPECEIDGLEYAVRNPNLDRAVYIWQILLPPYKNLIWGMVERSTHKNFAKSQFENMPSQMGGIVRENAWLPDQQGEWHVPGELTLKDLPESFSPDEELAETLGMKKSDDGLVKQLDDILSHSGIEIDHKHAVLELLTSYTAEELIEADRFLAEQRRQKQAHRITAHFPEGVAAQGLGTEQTIDHAKVISNAFNRPGETVILTPELVSHPVKDSQLRRDRKKQKLHEAREHEPHKEQRFRLVQSRQWEGNDEATKAFLEEEYGGRCQICGYTFARRKDGRPYFEAIYIVPFTQGRWLDDPGNTLCLCANHAAEFLNGAVEANFVEQVMEYQSGSEHILTIYLCGKIEKLRFSERHIIDLQALIEEISIVDES